mmetsp:Transcript_29441/g.44586  ORF Transcript_29441/g.44586 Transcript_29441/m.44586 type:complete len:264 (-) Transcript_29441:1796-2587(-)|eukprot:CAMPEP_0170499612 /NCGR_PEP_ID=MMETSP0208-20121228/31975_1 /TAXON_ID=197538 /ORGANISM="Strombidium inclinatum, Strain S3" /LENGTH=263 /DNA_ID=CAMNT_0010777239 /DNA_START=2769 /DNA_END=3560 /DNA_ORIENTATION=-
MCILGLNDVIYVVPEFSPRDYEVTYSKTCTGSEQEDFKPFFDHYQHFSFNPDPEVDNIPERMMGLNKNCMIAIEADEYEPDLRGRAFLNLKNLPNGHYSIFYLRIGQPISINSRLKVLGRAKNLFININREKISHDKKPQLDLSRSSSRISKRETSRFKIMKAKQSKIRDNKVLSLNSDNESESSEEENIMDTSKDDYKILKSHQQQPGSNSGVSGTSDGMGNTTMADSSKDDDMEFDSGPNKPKEKIEPPPLQNSKDYYNST